MLKTDILFKSDCISAVLISSSYAVDYDELDYSALPSISFPIKSGFRYRSGDFESIIDTNTVLFEAKNTEFIVSKFSEFAQDITLSFQFRDMSIDLFKRFTSKKPVETIRRTPQIEYLIQSFLALDVYDGNSLAHQIIDQLLFRELVDAATSVVRIQNIKPWVNSRMDLAKDYIHRHISDEISIADISASCCLSPFHFSREFKKITGFSPYEYLLKLRIAKAKQLLKSNESVTSAAFNAGFNSVENFSYGFKRIVGLSPDQYKKSKISKLF